jgi:hypothetical protein
MKRAALRIVVLVLFVLSAVQSGYHTTHAQGQNALSLTPSTGTPGSVVSLSAPPGSLPSNSIAEVDFVDATGLYVGLPLGRIQINADGSITNFPITIVPQAAAGEARIFVTSAGISISAPFTVQPGITVSPAISQQKLPIAVSGSGFSSNAAITFSTTAPNGTPQPAATADNALVIADALGTFSAMIVVPRGTPAGTLQVSATDGTYSATTTVRIMDPAALTTPAMPGTGTSSSTATPPPAGTPSPITTPGTGAYFAEGYTGQATTNGRASFDETLGILNPGSSAAQATITYIVQGSASVTVSHTVAPASVLRESVNADVGPDKAVGAIVTSSQRLFVTRTITRVDPNGARLDGSETRGAPAPSTTWGFPEGYTGFTFQEYLTLLNPGSTTAHVHVNLAPQAASAAGARTLSLTVPPMSRVTANINALNAANTAKSVGMLISSDQPVVAERVLYFGDGVGSGKFGSTVSSGYTAPATSLRFAYGSVSGGDQQFITVLNPATSGAPVSVTATYSDATGHGIGTSTVTVAPGTRTTIASNALVNSTPDAPCSVSLQASGPIEAEAAQYYGGSPNIGMHPGVAFPGMASASSDLFFSGLANRLPDDTVIGYSIYLYNPGAASVAAEATYFGASGAPFHATYPVAAGSIARVPVSNAVGTLLPTGSLGAEFTTVGSGGLVAYAVGATTDGRSYTEDVGVESSTQ